jgi:tRNA modification GTPase
MLREGVQVVIAGRPNVGKSSLLNMLVGHEKAIVTPCAGTTRDLVEEYINIAGLPVRLVDTAGVHAAQDPVEQIGVERARSAIAGADLILMVIDLSSGLGAADQAILEQVAALPHLLVGNKADLKVVEHGIDELSEPLISVSAQTGQGIELLREAIAERLMGRRVLEDSVLLANARQEQALQRALQGVSDALVGAQSGVAVDLLAVDLQFAYDSLGLLLGETVDEDIIEQVFSRFCIGK